MARETAEGTSIRWAKLRLLQEHYKLFNVFMEDMLDVMGFKATWLQHDIAAYLQYGPSELMVQAQRGQAKSTITAIFAVWSLIHDPKHRVLIVSAGGKQANEISTLVQRMILTVPVLECLRPDPNNGDRTSVEAFDVHYSLKGIDKSPSVACIGITGNLPGKRADLLIADDIESPKNAMNAGNRAILLQLSGEFSSICTNGRIVYLGTPQTGESVYNTLPGRGFDIRIWPGRYPTPAEQLNYGQYLAPSIIRRMTENPALRFSGGVLGDQGQPTDPLILDEEGQQKKEKDKGKSSYQLQYMLNTKLMDAGRHPLKLEQLVVLQGSGTEYPLAITRGMGPQYNRSYNSSGQSFTLTAPHNVSEETAKLVGVHMQLDPAGGGANGDETGYAVTGFLNGNVFLLACGGIPGGYELEQLEWLADLAVKHKPNVIAIEKNMGHGAFAKVWLPILRKKYKMGTITEEFVSGQKETRIIGTLEPVMGRGALVVMEDVIESDDVQTEKYDVGKRGHYSLFQQIAKITRARKALAHDDRLDALEGSVRYWLASIAIDQDARIEAEKKAKLDAFMKDPLGRGRYQQQPKTHGPSLFNKFRR
jgi:terminase large subunit-like protein